MSRMQPKVSTAGADNDLAGKVEEPRRELDEAQRREAAISEVLTVIGR